MPILARRALIAALAAAAGLPAAAIALAPPDTRAASPVPVARRTSTAAPSRGTLLRATRVAGLTRGQVRHRLRSLRLPGAPPDLQLPPRRVRFGVDGYRVTYATVGVAGAPTTATGLVVIPRRPASRLRTVSYAHGTMAARADAPSRSLNSLAADSALLFAGAGYATVAPDYLGLGFGPGSHPYMQLSSEQSASLDLLRAARTLATRHAHRLDRRVLVTGFSQGAVAAMGLAQLLQAGADAHFDLGALAPMSGPYAVQRVEVPACLDGRLDSTDCNYYLSYVMVAWQPIYHVFTVPGDVWRGRWAQDIASLFDGRHDDVAIIRALPHHLSGLFTADFLRGLLHPDAALSTAMRQTDQACAWTPRAPTRLYAAPSDEQVMFTNSRHCLAELRAHGARPALRVIGRSVIKGTGHFGSALAATPRVLAWFDRMTSRHSDRRGSIAGSPRSGRRAMAPPAGGAISIATWPS